MLDLVHDRESRAAGEKIRCPLLALWGARNLVGRLYDPLAVWREFAVAEVSGGPIDCGHYLAEEAPEAVQEAFLRFF